MIYRFSNFFFLRITDKSTLVKSKFYDICKVDFHDTIESIIFKHRKKGIILTYGDLKSQICETTDVLQKHNYVRMSCDSKEETCRPNKHHVW